MQKHLINPSEVEYFLAYSDELNVSRATSFNQDLSDWNVSGVNNMAMMFANTHALSITNKGLITESFASNSNWPYEWRGIRTLDDTNFQTAVNL